ncbi:MAG TPA: hypothetical protein VFR86_02930, partial [Burkholderiaceae bacterium]|nr:hypothetical protein [Burkholderiaceae bacterium]
PGTPSRFIAEMKLGETQPKVDPREHLRAIREQLAKRAAERAAQQETLLQKQSGPARGETGPLAP